MIAVLIKIQSSYDRNEHKSNNFSERTLRPQVSLLNGVNIWINMFFSPLCKNVHTVAGLQIAGPLVQDKEG